MGVALLIPRLGAWWVSAAFAGDSGIPHPGCPTRAERLDLLDEGEKALVEADFGTAETKLKALEGAFTCGPVVEAELLGRMWLLEGAWLTLQGDQEQGAESFRAAARVASATWVSDYGSKLRAQYEAAIATPTSGSTTLSVDPEMFRWIGAVDGVRTRFPTTVSPGLHLVQVGASEEDIRFSRIVVAFADTPIVVVTGLVEPTGTEPTGSDGQQRPTVEEKEPVLHAPWSFHVAAGGSASFGADPPGPEVGTKFAVPIETGVLYRPVNPVWTRLAVTAGPLLTGEFGWTDGDVSARSPSLLGFHVGGGFAARQGDMGLLAGWTWPGRFAFRGAVAGGLPGIPIRAEGRIGLNFPVGSVPETAVDVLLEFTPRLVRKRTETEDPS